MTTSDSLYGRRWPVTRRTVAGVQLTVVAPEVEHGQRRPWVWRAAFLGAFDAGDRALLEAGWHLVQVETPDRYGDPQAMADWGVAYDQLVAAGFDPRPAIIALSRGGLYAIAWAALHPDRVSSIYLDNPVCDLRSWPGGAPAGYGTGVGAPAQWDEMLQVFGLTAGDSAALVAASPISKLGPLAQAQVRLLVAYGDADRTVPAAENAEVLVRRYRELGGPVEVIVRPGADHHPHDIPASDGGAQRVRDFAVAAWSTDGAETS